MVAIIYTSENEESLRIKNFFNAIVTDFSHITDMKFMFYEYTGSLIQGEGSFDLT